MNYNQFEIKLLRELKRKKYADLEPWEKFFIKENVKLHRKAKFRLENELLTDNDTLDFFQHQGR